MKVLAAYLLAVLGGNKEPTAEDIKNILGSVGAADDVDERIELLLSQVMGKNLAELIECGREKLAVSGGGGALMGVNAIGDGGAGGVAEQKKEEKVEEKIDEDSDDDMVPFDIFGSDEE